MPLPPPLSKSHSIFHNSQCSVYKPPLHSSKMRLPGSVERSGPSTEPSVGMGMRAARHLRTSPPFQALGREQQMHIGFVTAGGLLRRCGVYSHEAGIHGRRDPLLEMPFSTDKEVDQDVLHPAPLPPTQSSPTAISALVALSLIHCFF